MRTVSGEIRDYVRPLVEEIVKDTYTENVKDYTQKLEKAFVTHFFFDNQNWVNSVLTKFRKDLRKHNKDISDRELVDFLE